MSDVADLFDDWAARGRAEGMEEGHLRTAGPLLDLLDHEGKRFLDLGCGNGWASRHAVARGAVVAEGIDASPGMVARATELAKGPARFSQADFAELPFEDDSFDVAWSMEALYYAPNPDKVLAEVARVLAPGGVLHIVIDYYEENPDSHSWPTDTGVSMVLRPEAKWRQAFENAGFACVDSERLRATDPEAEAWKREQGSLHVWGSLP